jgi:regulatory protein YycH of two-component signal transduction system YycFG
MQDKLFSVDSLLSEIYGVIGHAAESDREHLNVEEIEYIKRITKRMIKETKMESSKIALLMPEEIPQEIVVQILKRGAN